MKHLITIISLTFILPCFAQNPIYVNEAGLDIGNPHPFLNKGMKVDGYDYIEATIDIKEKGASLSWAPLLNTHRYIEVLSESRIQLSQKDDLTSLGLSIKFNPLNPRSTFSPPFAPKLQDPYGLTNAKTMRVKFLEDKRDELLVSLADSNCDTSDSEINRIVDAKVVTELRSGQLKCLLKKINGELEYLNSNIPQLSTSKEKETNEARQKLLSKARVNVRSTLETRYLMGIGDNNNELAKIDSEILFLNNQIVTELSKPASNYYLLYKEQLQSTSLPIITFSYISTYFKVLSGDVRDADENGLNDNQYNNKSTAWSLAVDWRANDRNSLSLLYSRSKERESAEEGMQKVNYRGVGVTWMYKIITLNRDSYKSTDDYKNSLFEPSINFGLAYEEKLCKSDEEQCHKGILQSRSITPFVDFKVSKSAQFRLGVPLRKDKLFFDEDGVTSVEVLASINFQLGNPQ